LAAGALFSAGAEAGTVTFDDSVGNSLLFQANTPGTSFSDQGLTFTNNGTYMYIWDSSSPNSNGTNNNIFAGFASGDYESITKTGGDTFNLNSLQLAISWYDSNPTEVITINGSPLTITQTLTTYVLNLVGVSQVNISGVASSGGYWTADNITYNASSATPLPSTWLMLAGGLVGLGFLAHRGTKRAVAASA